MYESGGLTTVRKYKEIMKKRSRIQKSSRKLTAGEIDDRTCEEKEKKLPGSRGRPRKTTSVNSSCNVNSLKDAKATDGMQKPTEVKFRSSGTWLETSSTLFSLFYRDCVLTCLLTDNHSSCIAAGLLFLKLFLVMLRVRLI